MPNSLEVFKIDYLASVAKGSSVNCQLLSFSPHLHTTHTEVLSHVLPDPLKFMTEFNWVQSAIPTEKIPVIYLKCRPSISTPEGDLVLSINDVMQAFDFASLTQANQIDALIIKLYPEDQDLNFKPQRYFSPEAIEKIIELFPNISHLLTDAPSLDKGCDGGVLASHRAFWKSDCGKIRTITEMCNFSRCNELASGTIGQLLLQVLPIWDGADAVPSRPILYVA